MSGSSPLPHKKKATNNLGIGYAKRHEERRASTMQLEVIIWGKYFILLVNIISFSAEHHLLLNLLSTYSSSIKIQSKLWISFNFINYLAIFSTLCLESP